MAKTDHGRDLTATEMAQMLDEYINSANEGRDFAQFAEQITCRTHRTLQQKIMSLFLRTIEAWVEDKGGHDARNAATVALAKKIVAATGDKYDRFLPRI